MDDDLDKIFQELGLKTMDCVHCGQRTTETDHGILRLGGARLGQERNRFRFYFKVLASPGRFELPTSRLGGARSIQLSYGDQIIPIVSTPVAPLLCGCIPHNVPGTVEVSRSAYG